MLCSLPPSYKHFRETILYGRDDLSIDDVRDALTQKDLIDHQLISKSSNNSNDGLFVRSRNHEKTSTSSGGNGGKNRGRSKSKKPNPNRNKSCNYCHIKGHIKSECWKWQKKQSGGDGKSGKGKEPHATAEASYVDTDSDSGALVATHGRIKGKYEWILDSGCSFHMTPNKDLFSSYEEYNGGNVTMGNNATCKVIGTGTVAINMFDGIVRTLTKVRHVPELKKNLISLGTLDTNGCKCIAEGGVMKVVKGALVLMKGAKVGSLYSLQGSTMVGSANVSTGTMSDSETKLWHLRLGHMGEHGMSELSKQGCFGS